MLFGIGDFLLEENFMGKERVYSCAEDIAMRLKEHRKYGKASLMVGKRQIRTCSEIYGVLL